MVFILIIATLLLIVIGVPLFAVIAALTAGCILLLGDGMLIPMVGDMYNAVNKDILLAIPFFVMAGNIMTHGSMAGKLINIARATVGWLPGGLGVSAITACVFFAAISGSSPVTLIAIGTMMFPALLREKYPRPLSIGLLTSGGTLGILIPPSIPMIIYSIVVSTTAYTVSVRDLFIAGVVPGMLIATMLVIYTAVHSKSARKTPFDMGAWWRACKKGVWSLFLPPIIMGGIYGGFFTATEASAVAVVYAFVIEVLVQKELKLNQLPGILVESAVTMGSLFVIIVCAISFNQFLTLEMIPRQMVEALSGMIDSKFSFLILVNIFLLFVGCFMDILSAILILGPILAPMAYNYGIHPVHFAIIYIVNLEIGYLTPPLGLNLFVASTVFKEPIGRIALSVLPFLFIMLLALVCITYIPGISLLFLD